MARGICIFAEHWNGEISSAVFELLTAAKELKEQLGEPIQIMLASASCDTLIEQMNGMPVDEIYAVKLEKDICFQEDVLAKVYAQMLEKIQPGCVLIPADDMGRSLFPRVAYRLSAGLTADCTELKAARREDGTFYIRQIKPSFEENTKVCICCKENRYPQMMTVREGIYEACEASEGQKRPEVRYMDVEASGKSGIELLEMLPLDESAGSLQSAEVVVVGGRGTLEKDNFQLMEQFAEKLGAAIGGTRPLMDMGKIPFDHQIGQTGCTIRPQICISFGASGAIQHTEGIKNTRLFLAVNKAEDAPVFQVADYGAVMDMNPVLTCLLEELSETGK